MKFLKYKLLQGVDEQGYPILIGKAITWSEANEEIAKREAYNEEYTLEDEDIE
jgi:hypothetical protein